MEGPAHTTAATRYAVLLSQAEDCFAGDSVIVPEDLRRLYERALPVAQFAINREFLRNRLEHFSVLTQPWTPTEAIREMERATRLVASPAIREARPGLLRLHARRRHLSEPGVLVWLDLVLKIEEVLDARVDAELICKAR